jgi:hypothetical protein
MNATMQAERQRYTAKWVGDGDETYTPEEAAELAQRILSDPFYAQKLNSRIIADLSDPARRVNGLQSVSKLEKRLEHERQASQAQSAPEAPPAPQPPPAVIPVSPVNPEQVEKLLAMPDLPRPIRKRLKRGGPAVQAEGLEMARQWLLERAEARRAAELAERKAVLHATAYEVWGCLHDLLPGFNPEQQQLTCIVMDMRERYLGDMAGLEYWAKTAQRLMKLWVQVNPLRDELEQLAREANVLHNHAGFLAEAEQHWAFPEQLEKWLAACQTKIQRRRDKAARKRKPQPDPDELSRKADEAKERFIKTGRPNAHGGLPRAVASKKAKDKEPGKGKKSKAGKK